MSRKPRFGLFYLVRRSVILTLPLILLASVIAGITTLPLAHALTGNVCLTDPSAVPPSGSPCPASPYSFSGPFPSSPQPGPTQIRVGVYIDGSDGLNAYDITLLTTAATLKPAGIDLAGTVLNSGVGPATVVLECLGGNLVAGTVCSSTDTAGTIHLAASAAPGAPLTTAPTSGILFTAIFNITATSASISLGFQTGCSQTSVAGGVCVTIANGSTTPDAETVQAATFNNSGGNSALEYYTIVANITSTTTQLGSLSGRSVLITVNFPNTQPLFGSTSVTLTTAVSAGFTAPNFGGNPSTVCSTFDPSNNCTTVMSLSTATAGTYSATVYGTYVGDDCGPTGPCAGTTYTLIGTLTININIQSVAWTINGVVATTPQTNYYAKGTQSLVEVFTSQGGYSGSVTLGTSACVPGTTGVVCPLSLPAPFSISAGGTVTQMISFTATGYGQLSYRNTMSATGLPVVTGGTDLIRIGGFSMVSSSSSVSFNSGGSSSVTVTLASLGLSPFQFAGAVATAFTSSPSGLNVACSPSSVTLTAGGTATTSCSFSATVGSDTLFTATITGAGGTNNAMTNSTSSIAVNVAGPPDFSMSASPTVVPATVGIAATSTMTISPLGGFTGNVALTSDNVACTLSPTTVTGGSGTSTLSCTFAATGSVTVTVTGTSGSLSHTATVDFTVTGAQDFTISASPTSVSVVVNSPGTSTITISPLNGFSGNVALTANNSACTLTPTTVTGGSGTSTLSCTFTSTGTVTVTVTGTSGSLSHTATVAYTVTPAPDFTISANPTAVDVNVNSAGTSLISISPLNGFTGAVALTSDIAACTLSPASVSGGSGSSTLSCTFSSTGSVTVTITGTSGSLSHATSVAFTVQDFTIVANPTSVSVNVNQAGASTITIAAVSGFSSPVSLSSDNAACTLTPTSVAGAGTSTLSCIFSSPGSVTVTVTGTSGSLSHIATVAYSVAVPDFSISANPATVSVVVNSAGTSTITISPVNGFTGTVSLTSNNAACTLTPTSISGGSGTSTLSCTFTSTGSVTVTVTGTSGSLTHSATVAYTVTPAPDFTVSANPTSVSATVGVAATSTITIAPLNGFTGTVALTSDNAACTLTPTSVTGGSGTSTLSCTFGAAGSVTVSVTGTSGSLSHSASVDFNVGGVPDFTISANPTSVTVTVNSAGTSTITISPVNGFTGTVTLATDNAACTVTPATVSGGSGTSTLSCTFTTAGTVTVTVTGTSGSLSHTATVDYTVNGLPDFTIAANPTSVTMAVGVAGTSTITISPLNGFTGGVALTSDSAACSVTPATLAGGSGTSTLSCTFTVDGSVTVTVTGTSGSLTHTANVDFTVTSLADFAVAANPTSVSVAVGSAGTSTVTITPLNGFTGDVALVADNAACSLTSATVTGGSGTSTLSCMFGAAGSVTVIVSGTSGSLSHTATVDFTVTPPALDDTSATVSCAASLTAGTTGSCSVTVADTTTPANTPSGTVSLTSSDVTVGTVDVSCILSGGSCTVTITGVAAGSFTVAANYGGDSSHNGSSGTAATITVTAVIPPLTVDFSFSPSSPTVGQSVSFTPVVSGGIAPYTYAWAFGDGATSTAANPSHTYSVAGGFTVKLTVTDSSSPALSQSASHN